MRSYSKKSKSHILLLFLTVSLVACTGTDLIDDLQVERKIELTTTQIALQPGGTSQVMADYYDEFGIKKDVQLQYTSSNIQAVQVDGKGKITALANGRAVIEIAYQGLVAAPLNVNVVTSTNEVALVAISSSKSNLKPAEKIQLQSSVKNIIGGSIAGRPIEWFSENLNILSINLSGEVTAVAPGVAAIHAKVDGVKSNSLIFTVNAGDNTGTFVSAGGYQAIGQAILKEENGQLILNLSNDFKTSFALGTFVYLANSTNGSQVRSAGLEIEQISTNGAHTFNITSKYPKVKISDYRYVIILCKPASVTFGYADLN